MCVIYGRGERGESVGPRWCALDLSRGGPSRSATAQKFEGENGRVTCRGVKERIWNEEVCVRVCEYMCLCMIDTIGKSAGVCEREGEKEEGMNE